MAQLAKAPWAKRRISETELHRAVLDGIAGKLCWKCGKYMGSMLLFDFGEKVLIPSFRGGMLEAGEATVGVRDCYWELRRDYQVVITSDLISDENATKFVNQIHGAKLIDLGTSNRNRKTLDLHFSSGSVLSLDLTNRYVTQDPIVEFVTSDGRIYEVTPKGQFFLADRVSKVRFVQ